MHMETQIGTVESGRVAAGAPTVQIGRGRALAYGGAPAPLPTSHDVRMMRDKKLGSARILVVDDEQAYVQLLQRFLESVGYRNVRTTTDPREVAGIFDAFEPDLILLDLRMPDMDGIEVMKQLHPRTSEFYLPILVLTGDITEDAKRRSLSGGAKDFLNKPFDLTEVRLRIENLLETRFLHLELREQNEILEERVRERTKELEEVRLEILERLSLASDYRDDATGRHTKRVSEMAGLIAAELGLPADEVEHIRLAASLHDIGKIGIPDLILLKAGELTPEEVALMKTHTTIGAKVLSGSRSRMLQMAEVIALAHHERWDGLGYPRGLKGDEIPLAARVVSLADVVDALASDRPYRDAWPKERIAAEIARQSGRQFDPGVVEAYIRVLERRNE
jgi:putative two-component system response regulator